jgi:hypothetical protein
MIANVIALKRILLIVIISFSAMLCFAQSEVLRIDNKAKNRYVFWMIPSAATNIYGIAFGPIGSESICNRPYTKYSHGLNIQFIGQGVFQAFYIKYAKFEDFDLRANEDPGFFSDSLSKRAIHNGILLSSFGTFTDQVNGVSLSPWMSMGKKVNGISFNLLWNRYERINGVSIGLVNHAVVSKGLQIGLVNKAKKNRGFQFGLWNKNEKRSLPLVNWSFKDM